MNHIMKCSELFQNETLLSLTFKNLDVLMDCLSVTKKLYPLSWSEKDEETFKIIRDAYFTAFKGRSNDGEEKSGS